MNIYQTKTMLAAVNQMTPATAFLRDRYFPSAAGDQFPTEEVLIEYKDSTGKKLAPVVLPRKGSISVEREGYTTEKMVPPLVAPSRALTIDELNKKGFGEDLSFCWRARECGYKVLLDPTVKCGHVGHIVVTEQFFNAYGGAKNESKS